MRNWVHRDGDSLIKEDVINSKKIANSYREKHKWVNLPYLSVMASLFPGTSTGSIPPSAWEFVGTQIMGPFRRLGTYVCNALTKNGQIQDKLLKKVPRIPDEREITVGD